MHTFLGSGRLPGEENLLPNFFATNTRPLEHIRFTKFCPLDNDKIVKNFQESILTSIGCGDCAGTRPIQTARPLIG